MCQFSSAPPFAQLPPPLTPQARTWSRVSRTAISRASLERLKMPKIPTDSYPLTLARLTRRPISRRALQLFPQRRSDRQTWGHLHRCLRSDSCRIALVCVVSVVRVCGTGNSQSHAIVVFCQEALCQYHIWCCLRAPRIVLTGWGRECGGAAKGYVGSC